MPITQELLVTRAQIKGAERSAKGGRKKRETGEKNANKTSSKTVKR